MIYTSHFTIKFDTYENFLNHVFFTNMSWKISFHEFIKIRKILERIHSWWILMLCLVPGKYYEKKKKYKEKWFFHVWLSYEKYQRKSNIIKNN